MDEVLPRDIGRYTLLRSLGAGGQGRVYEAVHRVAGGLTRYVALKQLNVQGEDLRREARLGGLLRHPHLVDVYEVGKHDGTWFCAMELCWGGSLADRGPLSRRSVVEVGLQVCDALAYAHEELELVHLDLKPANLLLQDGAVKVADLGIATARGFEGDGRVRGTPRFMAPEQRLGLAVDARTDIYALGVLLRELATGGTGKDEVTLAPDAPALTQLASEVAWLEPVLERCTEPDARDRFASMHELARALRALPVDGPSLVERFAATPPPADRGGQPPVAVDRLYGRDALLAILEGLLGEPCLVTLKGSAGIGKTHLARLAARRYQRQTGQEAWLVDLAPVRTQGELLQQVARALEVSLTGAPERHVGRLGAAIAGRSAPLLVLDGFEHIVGHGQVIEQWAAQAPRARWLATSRIPLGVASERVLEVPPLEEVDAVALLAGRALQRGADVALDPVLPELARRLDGVPLALELAAGRLGILSPAEVLDRLGLSLLRSGKLHLSPRQATVRGALDWSWELLGEREQAALAQLSVFRGGFGPDDVEAVLELAGGSLEVLQALADQSLLVTREERLDLLATVQVYASERLAERGETRQAERRHARWFARYGANAAVRAMAGPGHARLLRERARDLANLVAAAERSVASGEGELAARASLGATAVMRLRGPMGEGLALLTQALTVCPDHLRVELLVQRASMYGDAGLLSEAEDDLAAARVLCQGDLALEALVAQEQGDIHLERGDLEPAAQHYAAALALCEQRGASPGRALLCLGAAQVHLGPLSLAEQTCRQAVAELRRTGDRLSEALALGNLGVVLRLGGRPDEARVLYHQALAIGEQLGARASVATDHGNLAIIEAHAGRLEQSREHFEHAVALFRACGIRGNEGLHLTNLAALHLLLGDPAGVRRHGEAALVLLREVGNHRLEGLALQQLASAADLDGDRTAARGLLETSLACYGDHSDESLAALAHLELARLELEEEQPAAALARLEPVLSTLERDVTQRARALAMRGEARARLGEREPARADFDEAIGKLRSLSPYLCVQAMCGAARAFQDSRALSEAVALASGGTVREGSPGARALERTRLLLGSRP